MKKHKFKKSGFNISLVFLLIGLVPSCTKTIQYSHEGWNVLVNARREFITIKHDDLGIVLKDIHLNLRKDAELFKLSGWDVKKNKDILTITTTEPEGTQWEFKITKEGVAIKSSAINGIITCIAPASGGRIPARVANQDNGVIYNSIGFVSARNIYNLFDRLTNTLIQFPKGSDLSRNSSNEELMDVTLPVIEGFEISLIPNYYTEVLGLYKYEPYYPQYEDRHPFKRANTGWLNWYCYYMASNEEDMVKETDELAKTLKPYGLEYVQLDATYSEGGEANLLEWNKEKFPHGGKWLMQYIKSKGLRPGLWVNAYGANYPRGEFMDKYPENWFLHDENGKVFGACCTADSTVAKLDFSNPEVFEKHLKPLFKTYVEDWGIEYLKDAGHGEWMFTYAENKDRVFDQSQDGVELYWEVQKIIRDIMGPKNWVMGCDAEGGADRYCLGFGIFDSAFNIRDDVYAVWEQYVWAPAMGTKMHLATIFCTNYLNDIVIYNDPDATMIRPPLTTDEAINNVSTTVLSGQSYTISDFMSQPTKERIKEMLAHSHGSWGKEFPQLIKKLSDDRVELYKKTMPTMDITPIDLFPYRSKAEYAPLPDGYPDVDNLPKALDLKVNAASGIYDVVAIYNWLDEPDTKVISFGEDLGLDPEKEYLIFDFWNQELEGIFKEKIHSEVPPHGVRVFVVRSLSNRPQLLATSRHITGAFSIKALKWNPTKLTLSGKSQAVPEASYSLFIYVPPEVSVSKVDANTSNLSHNIIQEHVLEVSFTGKKEPVKWMIEFESKE
ncbi:alpha-galactosidase [candidate division WOR-3 bacterium]|nr:alpha-galactosidase [candidate division WOR-3 bacterium]